MTTVWPRSELTIPRHSNSSGRILATTMNTGSSCNSSGDQAQWLCPASALDEADRLKVVVKCNMDVCLCAEVAARGSAPAQYLDQPSTFPHPPNGGRKAGAVLEAGTITRDENQSSTRMLRSELVHEELKGLVGPLFAARRSPLQRLATDTVGREPLNHWWMQVNPGAQALVEITISQDQPHQVVHLHTYSATDHGPVVVLSRADHWHQGVLIVDGRTNAWVGLAKLSCHGRD